MYSIRIMTVKLCQVHLGDCRNDCLLRRACSARFCELMSLKDARAVHGRVARPKTRYFIYKDVGTLRISVSSILFFVFVKNVL
jgi:hypothetical protein